MDDAMSNPKGKARNALGDGLPEIGARLDRLGTSRYVWWLVALLAFGGFFESYLISTGGGIAPGLIKSGLLTATTKEFFSMKGFAGFSAATFTGNGPKRSLKVSKCCFTSRVVGHRIATWVPSWIALNAARTAISVLPKPTSPQMRRSMGMGFSMSALTSSMVLSWSGVSTNANASSSSRCHGVSGPNSWPRVAIRAL